MRASLPVALLTAFLALAPALPAQEPDPRPQSPKSDPQYQDTFSGPVLELSEEKITVTRTVLGKPERKTFWIKADTKIEGKLKVKAKVTIGYVASDSGDVARLIVVRGR